MHKPIYNVSETRQNKKDNRRQFLLKFFDREDGYEEKEVNGFWLIKQWNGDSKQWIVHIFSPQSYANYTGGLAKWRAVRQQSLLDSEAAPLVSIVREDA